MSGNFRRGERVSVEFFAECDICGYMVSEASRVFADADMAEHLMRDHKEQAALIDDGSPVTL